MPDEQPSLFEAVDRDPHPAGPQRFVGRKVRFDHTVDGAAPRELFGVVENARYTGRSARGSIPDYLLIVRGKSGRLLDVSLVESRATFPEST